MPRVQLSPNFWLDEFTRSGVARRLGIDNSPSAPQIKRLETLAKRCLQPIRDRFGPVTVLSGYRCPALNRAVGSSDRSAHPYGLAADITVPGHSTAEVIRWASQHLPEFDQLINEFGDWTHIGLARPRAGERRKQVINAIHRNGKVVYQKASAA